jgi:ribosome-associated protein
MSDATTEDEDSGMDRPTIDDAELVAMRPLRLDQFLKMCGLTSTGGQAKLLIQGGQVHVNGELELRRRRKLTSGDVVQFDGQSFAVDEYTEDV